MSTPRRCRVGQLTSLAAGDGSPRQQGAGLGVRPNACRVNPLNASLGYRVGSRMHRLRQCKKWTEVGSILESTSWAPENAMAMMAGGPAVKENKGGLSVCMSNGFPEDVGPPPQSVADVERSQYKASWHEAMKSELDGHKTTGTYEAAMPPRGRQPVGAQWVFSYKTEKDGLIIKTSQTCG